MSYVVATGVPGIRKAGGLGRMLVMALAITVAESSTVALGQQTGNGFVSLPDAPGFEKSAGSIRGTVIDANGQPVPHATVVLHGAASGDSREVTSADDATFALNGVRPGVPYHVSVSARGFATWNSSPIVLQPGQFLYLTDIQLGIVEAAVSVTVYASPMQLAEEQVQAETQQRVLGFIPNFYVVYDPENAAPLPPRLKFKLAMKLATDPITAGGVLTMASVNQLAHTPDYRLGAAGYGQRVGAVAADGFSNIMIGAVILPSVLHQDPRYFYKGSGTTGSRVKHAVAAPFITRGENGRMQPNYSSVGGDLASSALLMTYYPDSNRTAGMVFQNFAIDTAERVTSALAQEFIIPRLMLKKGR